VSLRNAARNTSTASVARNALKEKTKNSSSAMKIIKPGSKFLSILCVKI
jgi:hypothetical protein